MNGEKVSDGSSQWLTFTSEKSLLHLLFHSFRLIHDISFRLLPFLRNQVQLFPHNFLSFLPTTISRQLPFYKSPWRDSWSSFFSSTHTVSGGWWGNKDMKGEIMSTVKSELKREESKDGHLMKMLFPFAMLLVFSVTFVIVDVPFLFFCPFTLQCKQFYLFLHLYFIWGQ